MDVSKVQNLLLQICKNKKKADSRDRVSFFDLSSRDSPNTSSSRGSRMWAVAIQLKSNWEFLLSWIAKQPLCGHCFAAARNDRFVIIDIYVLRYRYICVAPPLCIIFLSSLTKQKKKSWQFRTSLLIWLIIYCIFHT